MLVVIDTPKGSRKFVGRKARAVQVERRLRAPFPYDFGFVPSTLTDDGDPIDVLVLMEESRWLPVPSRHRRLLC